MQPLYDNLAVMNPTDGNGSASVRSRDFLQSSQVEVTPLAYIRGRSLHRVFFIVDEAQNLTPHEIKTIITRWRRDKNRIHGRHSTDRSPLFGFSVQRIELPHSSHGRPTALRTCVFGKGRTLGTRRACQQFVVAGPVPRHHLFRNHSTNSGSSILTIGPSLRRRSNFGSVGSNVSSGLNTRGSTGTYLYGV